MCIISTAQLKIENWFVKEICFQEENFERNVVYVYAHRGSGRGAPQKNLAIKMQQTRK
jgi:hypothetical protein